MSLCLSGRDAEAEAFTEMHKPGFTSATSSYVSMMSPTVSNHSIRTTSPPSAPAPAVPPVSFPLFDPVNLREVSPQKPQLGPGGLGELLLPIIIRDIYLPVCMG